MDDRYAALWNAWQTALHEMELAHAALTKARRDGGRPEYSKSSSDFTYWHGQAGLTRARANKYLGLPRRAYPPNPKRVRPRPQPTPSPIAPALTAPPVSATAPPTASGTDTPAGRTASTETRQQKVEALIDALREGGLWGVTIPEIARLAGVSPATAYRYVKKLPVKKAWDRYRRDSAGRSPSKLRDL